MNPKEFLEKEIEQMPESLVPELLNFIRYLKYKNKIENIDTAILSETALFKDWSTLEEDEAWQHL